MSDLEELATEENYPNEFIRSVFLRSRKYDEVEHVLEVVKTMLVPLQSFKSGKEYSRKILLVHYQSELKKRLKYLSKEKRLRELEKRDLENRTKRIDERVSDKVISKALDYQKIDRAKKALINLQEAQLNVLIDVEHNTESKKLHEQTQEFIKRGYSPSEALKKASRGDIASTSTTVEDLDKVAGKTDQQIKEEKQKEQDQQDQIESSNPNIDDMFSSLNQEIFSENQLSTKKNPIRLKKEPQKDLEKGA